MPSYRENDVLRGHFADLLPLYEDNKTAVIEAAVRLLWQARMQPNDAKRDDLLESLRSKALAIVAEIHQEMERQSELAEQIDT